MTYGFWSLRALQGYHADLHSLLPSTLQQLHHLGMLGPLAVLAVHRDDVVSLLQPGFLRGRQKMHMFELMDATARGLLGVHPAL